MLMRFHLFMGLMIVFLAVAPGWTADPISGIRLDQPLEITSGRLEVFQNEQKTVFSDQVEATQKDFRLNTDRLTVYYDKQQSRVERLEAEGPRGMSGWFNRIARPDPIRLNLTSVTIS